MAKNASRDETVHTLRRRGFTAFLRPFVIGSMAVAVLGPVAAAGAQETPPSPQPAPPTQADSARGVDVTGDPAPGAVVPLANELVNAVAEQPTVVMVRVRSDAAREAAGGDRGRPADVGAYAAGLQRSKDALDLPAGATVFRTYANLPLIAVRVNSVEALQGIATSPAVVGVQKANANERSLTQSLSLISQPTAAASGYTGAGTQVAVLDTGVDFTRSAFGSCTAPGTPSACKVISSVDTAPTDSANDEDGHGTNVSGIVVGVAPATKLRVYDVFDTDGLAYDWDIAAAIDDVIAKRSAGQNIRAANLSLGSTAGSSCYSDTLGLSDLSFWGVTPTVSSGNDANSSAISWPACMPDAIAVGAVYDANLGTLYWSACTDTSTAADKIACFSNSSSRLDVLAPGAMILAAGISYGGTSQAAPHVAGAAAVLGAIRPDALPGHIRGALVTTGPFISDSRNGLSRRRLNLNAAALAVGTVELHCTNNVACDPDNDYLGGTFDTAPDNPCFPNPLATACRATGSVFVPITPKRIVDSRNGLGTTTGKFGPDASRAVTVSGANGIPTNATAVVLNVTAVSGTENTYLTVYPDGATRPNASSLNVLRYKARPNAVVAPAGAAGKVRIYNRYGSVHVAVDVAGYFVVGGSGAGLTTMTPVRLLNTRDGTGGFSTPFGAGSARLLQVGGVAGVPANATAAVVNITAVAGTETSYFSAYPDGGTRPAVSAVNWTPGEVSPNMAIVPLSAGGAMRIYNRLGQVDGIVDLVGYFQPSSGAKFRPVTPYRTLDSRNGTGTTDAPFVTAETRDRYIPSSKVPTAATAMVGNVTGIAETTTYVTMFPSGTTRPVASTLNLVRNDARANAVVSGLGTGSKVSLFNKKGNTELILDVSGWFGPDL